MKTFGWLIAIVLVFFGPAWVDAAPILSALALWAGLRSLSNHGGDVLKAIGRPHVLAVISIAHAVVLVPALIYAASHGAAAVAATVAGLQCGAVFIKLAIASRIIGVSLLEIGQSFVRAATAGVDPRVVAMVRDLLLAEGRLTASGPLLFYAALKLDADQLAARTSRVFLGMRLECAQCHDHPFERWSQDDYYGLAAYFSQARNSSKVEVHYTRRKHVTKAKRATTSLYASDTSVPLRWMAGRPWLLASSTVSDSGITPMSGMRIVSR